MKTIIFFLVCAGIFSMSGCSADYSERLDANEIQVNEQGFLLPVNSYYYVGSWDTFLHSNRTVTKASNSNESYWYMGSVSCFGETFPLSVVWSKDGDRLYDCYAGAEGTHTDSYLCTSSKLVFVSSQAERIENGVIYFVIKCNYFFYYTFAGGGHNPGYKTAHHVAFALSFDTNTEDYSYSTHTGEGIWVME